MHTMREIMAGMDPEKALEEVAEALKELLRDLGKDAASDFVMNLIEHSGGDKLTSMVHL